MQKSASLPIERFPLLIRKIFAGLDVNDWMIVSSFTDPLWYNSNDKASNVSIPEAPVAACEKENLVSKSKNTSIEDKRLQGKVTNTFVKGKELFKI